MTLTVEQIFTDARSQNGYLDEPVSDDTLRRLYATLKWGPTSANSSPARFAFVRSAEARRRLIECVSPGNSEKVRQAPVTVIIGMDMRFHDELPALFPHADARSWFVNQPALIESTAFRNSSLQGAYLIIAARALGLDCGPMSGFDGNKVNEAFWAGSTVRTNFICTLGRGDRSKIFPRNPRFSFEKACSLL
ncbi:malonic semialdehyde reductase [Variovorax sp. WS11]|uniref:malonic semialdehyde reductase n=1 Tax=Variovorax sp. WS11 TaxID=1105204 RepID=UPI000D0CEAA9|nr:malonic semialdehyde reductase [Variovorax sp. WS11]NDZ17501.1 malonic semialdehyde reductase [Variovorax sp. WS11]PSL85966.1 malonic semialdehyde reductase [Variovorax sp. WS11]